ncbi:ZP domain-containing protein-like [Oculina patagonica]
MKQSIALIIFGLFCLYRGSLAGLVPDFTGDAQEAVVDSLSCGADGQNIEFVINIPDIAEWGNDDAAAWALVGTSDASCQPSFTVNADKVTYGPFDGNTCKKTITETSTHLEFLFEIDVVQPTPGVSFAYDHHYEVTCRYNKVEQNIQGSFLPLHSVSNTDQNVGQLTFSFELLFTADNSIVDPGTTIDLTTDIFGRLTVNAAGFPALDVHYASVAATSDNMDSVTLITDGCSDNPALVNDPQCNVNNVEDFAFTQGAFRFTGQTDGALVTFHITAEVCLDDASLSQCEDECDFCANPGRKRRESVKEALTTKYYLTVGPYKFANVEQEQKDTAVGEGDEGDGSAFPTYLVAILVVSGVVVIAVASAAVVIVLRKRRRNATLAESRGTYDIVTAAV